MPLAGDRCKVPRLLERMPVLSLAQSTRALLRKDNMAPRSTMAIHLPDREECRFTAIHHGPRELVDCGATWPIPDDQGAMGTFSQLPTHTHKHIHKFRRKLRHSETLHLSRIDAPL